MANLKQVRRNKIKVVLSDGVERELKFSLNAMADLEDKYGTVDNAFKELEEGHITAVRYILWAALRDDDESLTERQVGGLIELSSIGDIMKAMNSAATGDMPEPEPEKESAVASVATNNVVEGAVVDFPN